jgi:hypothetical protein
MFMLGDFRRGGATMTGLWIVCTFDDGVGRNCLDGLGERRIDVGQLTARPRTCGYALVSVQFASTPKNAP